MINLFNINNYKLNTSDYSNLLHDDIVTEFENTIADYVGAKYAVSFNSATSAIFLVLSQYKNLNILIPSVIPPVVLNAILTSGNYYTFVDNVDWVGDSYVLHKFEDYKIVDSAQKLERNQFINECDDNDLMIFSFYPTKPVGSIDGGMIVSNDYNKIQKLKEMAINGMSFAENNWERKIKFPGYKMYMNSIQADIALRNFKIYDEKLKIMSEILENYNSILNLKNKSFHLYRIEVEDRKNFMNYMSERKILTGIHYEALHMNPVYKINNQVLIMSEKISKKTISIPYHEKLTKSNLKYIIECIKNSPQYVNK